MCSRGRVWRCRIDSIYRLTVTRDAIDPRNGRLRGKLRCDPCSSVERVTSSRLLESSDNAWTMPNGGVNKTRQVAPTRRTMPDRLDVRLLLDRQSGSHDARESRLRQRPFFNDASFFEEGDVTVVWLTFRSAQSTWTVQHWRACRTTHQVQTRWRRST
jgi:hypothetical protein